MRDSESVLRSYGKDYDTLHGSSRRAEGVRPYGGQEFRVTLPGEQTLTSEKFVGQTQSYSVAPKLGDAGYAEMQDALRDIFAKWSVDGVLRMRTECEVVGWRTPA